MTIQGKGGPIEVLPVLQSHGEIASLGFRFGNVAYSADIKALPEACQHGRARGLDRRRVAQAPASEPFQSRRGLALDRRIKPKRAILTNLHTDMDYDALRAELPPIVEPGFDGMSFTVG